jgi:hypothetical protein
MDNFLGDWVNKIDDLNQVFINNKPFPYLVIQNFLNKRFMERVANEFPDTFEDWNKYNNPLEVKYATNDINQGSIKLLFDTLKSTQFIEAICKLTGIKNLEADPTLHGAGLHVHPKNGRLFVHLDYEKHPILTDKERRINIVLYVSRDWQPEWNGQTELWDASKCVYKSEVVFNNAIIFQTSEESWHGLPNIIKCPDNTFRKTIGFYYISDIVSGSNRDKIGNDGSGYRTKATYINVGEPDKRIDEFIKIRPLRRITQSDIESIWPEWTDEL